MPHTNAPARRALLLTALLSLPVCASVQTPEAAPAQSLTFARLEQIQSQTILYEAQAARDKAKRGISGEEIPAPMATPSAGKTEVKPTRQSPALPRVREISGAGTHLSARLVLSDGAVAFVATGQPVPGSEFTVKKISARAVSVTDHNGRVISLPMMP